MSFSRLGPSIELPVGVFIVSLDFELAWGTRGRANAARVGPSLDGTRSAIRSFLAACEEFEVPATWAIVGALLLETTSGIKHPWLDEPRFQDVPVGNSQTQPHWYAQDMLEWIRSCPAPQEIGCHTLTHPFVQDCEREEFRLELARFLQLFEVMKLPRPVSFIFPKHKMAHFDVLAEMGFTCYRGPEPKWFESLPGVYLPAALRLADAKLCRPPNTNLPRITAEGLCEVPSSQFYSPFMSVGKYVSVDARVTKALKGLRQAADQRKVFHLWTHPFNLGVRTAELMSGITEIFREARRLEDQGKLRILTMGAFAQEFIHSETPNSCVTS